MTGFEPATSSSRTKRATGLRYIPKKIKTPSVLGEILQHYLLLSLIFMVGMTGFEPATPTSLTWCANRAALHPEKSSANLENIFK